ncbi:MAG TPA: ABC transporter permease [Dehalococcoidia bacterium]|nr:ABC transporter permease [Dehalococcoidia bacterium]
MAYNTEAVVLPPLEEVATSRRRSGLRAAWWFVRKKPLGAFGAIVLAFTLIVAVFSPWIAQFGYTQQHLVDSLQSPNGTYWFGTDFQGRDVFSRIVIGSQVTVLVGIGSVTVAAFLSVLIGGVSGYFGGRTDIILQRLVDIWVALPPIFLLITFVSVLGSGGEGFLGIGRGPDVGLDPTKGDWIWYTFFRSTVVTFSLGIILAGYGVRIVRGAVLSIMENTYIDAARAVGAGDIRIMWHYILPNIMPVVIILATVNLGVAVLAEATISFLGFGIQAPFPTWGQMLGNEGRTYGPTAQWLMWFPGIAIFISVYGFNMLGDALRDVLDPRLRGAR